MQAFSIIAVRLMAGFYFLTSIMQLPLFFYKRTQTEKKS